MPGWNFYVVGEWKRAGFSLERVAAVRPFAEYVPSLDRPRAWNVELVFHPVQKLELGLRYERAAELEDEVARSGGELTWRPHQRLSFTLEFLEADLPGIESGEEDETIPPRRRQQMYAVSFSCIF